MNKRSLRLFLVLIIVMLITWMLTDTFNQSGIADLRGGFIEVAKYRNENNTGPVQRIYAVSLKDTTAAMLEDYGNLMPHNKYGNTKVYFFIAGSNIPTKLSPGGINFDARFNSSCYALYEKSAMGNVGVIKNPFKIKH